MENKDRRPDINHTTQRVSIGLSKHETSTTYSFNTLKDLGMYLLYLFIYLFAATRVDTYRQWRAELGPKEEGAPKEEVGVQ